MSFEFSKSRPFRRATAWTGAALVAATLGVAGWQAGGARAETPAAAVQGQPAVGPRPGIHGAVTSYADAVARVAPAVVTVRVDRKNQVITRFDAVGVGLAWGRRTAEIRLDRYPWMYGIACELVTGDAPQDLIPPYNLLHYNPTGPYFER